MAGRPLFSVIVPVLDCGARRLGRTLRSVAAQDPDLFECLVVDGGSTDDTLAALEEHRGAGPIDILAGRDRGIYDAMNRGVRATAGKYLHFLGAGDCLRPAVLRQVREALPPGERILAYGDVCMLDRGGERYAGRFDRSKLRRQNICHQAIFYERQIFAEVGGFDLKYPVLADYEFNLRCFGHPRVRPVYLDLVIADYEGGGASSTSWRRDTPFLRDYSRLVRRHLGWRQYLLRGADIVRYRASQLLRGGGR